MRRFRLGLERDVKKTMSKEDFWIIFEARDLIKQGYGPEAIHMALIEKLNAEKPPEWYDLATEEIEGLIDRLQCSRQNFFQWLQRLKLI